MIIYFLFTYELDFIEEHQYGWTVTTLALETAAWIRETIGEAGINTSRLQELGATKGRSMESKNRSIKSSYPLTLSYTHNSSSRKPCIPEYRTWPAFH